MSRKEREPEGQLGEIIGIYRAIAKFTGTSGVFECFLAVYFSPVYQERIRALPEDLPSIEHWSAVLDILTSPQGLDNRGGRIVIYTSGVALVAMTLHSYLQVRKLKSQL